MRFRRIFQRKTGVSGPTASCKAEEGPFCFCLPLIVLPSHISFLAPRFNFMFGRNCQDPSKPQSALHTGPALTPKGTSHRDRQGLFKDGRTGPGSHGRVQEACTGSRTAWRKPALCLMFAAAILQRDFGHTVSPGVSVTLEVKQTQKC